MLLLLLVVALYSVVHVSLGHKSIIIKRNKNTVCRPLKNALKYRYRFPMIFYVQIVYRNSVKHEPRNMPSKFGGYSKTSRSKQTVCQLFPISMGTRSLAIRDDDAKHVLDELVCGPPCTFPCYSVVCAFGFVLVRFCGIVSFRCVFAIHTCTPVFSTLFDIVI